MKVESESKPGISGSNEFKKPGLSSDYLSATKNTISDEIKEKPADPRLQYNPLDPPKSLKSFKIPLIRKKNKEDENADNKPSDAPRDSSKNSGSIGKSGKLSEKFGLLKEIHQTYLMEDGSKKSGPSEDESMTESENEKESPIESPVDAIPDQKPRKSSKRKASDGKSEKEGRAKKERGRPKEKDPSKGLYFRIPKNTLVKLIQLFNRWHEKIQKNQTNRH